MNFKQRLGFTLLMSIGMATSMSWLGMAKSMGINGAMWRVFLLALAPTIAFAFVFNFLVVATLTNWLVKWWTKGMTDTKAIGFKSGAIRGWIMLLMMSFTMSTRALLINGTFFHLTVSQFILSFFGTFTMAYFVRDILIMPLVRHLLFHAMPRLK
ncbi:hypothetical protein ACFQH1_06630 [Lactiplantibacillus daoliensis]|uniref:DUF2798 domain-containing protein n=1 Tax=Lactiplantibacillus daoliensis TaxID=2559916 RepID=A0ABW1UHU2_9LACO|nr:hypothetical protein [Lactiplantibacillus daoliensis]